LRIPAIEKNEFPALRAYQRESLISSTAIVEHQCHVGDWRGVTNGALGSRKPRGQLIQWHAMAALFFASFDTKYGQFR
jgi:hypothetical protein